ncbi:hypothetical protein F5X71_00130 [Nocardia brasiliensis]|uniref:Uncharacterized protein n=1 Tax=Nocardia brasiliensis TaxID=37326 RepID=A0A6G9XJ58_NOCBR|nr:hypothetical protein [Nocardia brasiliensis]QIS00944.1 hypothetical protein F5X71_00130 [Nocardia brasiliensis]
MENIGSDADQFAALVLQQLTAEGEVGAEYDPQEFVIRLTSGWKLFLGNIFREANDLPADERTARITRFLSSRSEAPALPGWPQVRSSLRPILRSETFGIGSTDADDPRPITRPALPFLNELVAVDLPSSRSIVNERTIEQWGVDAAEVFAAARENLTALVGSGGFKEPGVLFFDDDGDGYCTSWPLIPGWLAGCGDGTQRPIAFVPEVDRLIIAPDGDDLGPLFEYVEQQYREAARQISPQGYTVDDAGAVIPLDQSPRHQHLPFVQRARCGLALTEYEAQGSALTEQLDTHLALQTRDGEIDGAFVGSVMYIGADSGPYTVTIWGEGVEYFLPEADYVMFCVDEQGEKSVLFTVPFAAVVDIVGLTPIPDLTPPRYEIRHWPDAEVRARLAAAAVEP